MFTPQIVKPATSSDVAQAAGVSRATVSLVLNNRESARIPEDTRIRVREAARLLGYVPNNAARALKTSTNQGWLLVGEGAAGDTALGRAIGSVAAELADDGEDVYRDLDSRVAGADAASSWAHIRPAGVIASTQRCTPEATELLRTAGIRTLLVYGNQQAGHAPSIVLPQRDYGRVAVDYLQRQGHQRLLCLMPSAADHDDDVSERLAGILDEKSEDTTVTVVRTEPSSSAMRDWAHGWRYTRNRPTATICYDDEYARAAIRALHDAGLTCPGDVAVLGAEDMLFSPEHIPAISSISFSSDTMAERIRDAIQALMSGERVERVDPPPSRLIKRESA